MEHEEQTEKLSRELERLDEHSDEVGEQIDDARRDWEAKAEDPAVPGAQPVPDEEARSGDEESPGAHGKERTATGNPDAAGAHGEDEEDSSDA
jgi:hypothetical protein